jgi:hypothetical protein
LGSERRNGLVVRELRAADRRSNGGVVLHAEGKAPASSEKRRHMTDPIRRAWLEYAAKCERFDRLLPGGWSKDDDDVWRPASEAMPLSVAHARAERDKVFEMFPSVPRGEIEKQRRAVDRLLYRQILGELARGENKEGQ